MTTEQIDREIIAAVRDGEDDAAFVDRLAPCEARDFALGRDGFGAVSADYIPARDLSSAEKVERGQRIFIRSRLAELSCKGIIRWHYEPEKPGRWLTGKPGI